MGDDISVSRLVRPLHDASQGRPVRGSGSRRSAGSAPSRSAPSSRRARRTVPACAREASRSGSRSTGRSGSILGKLRQVSITLVRCTSASEEVSVPRRAPPRASGPELLPQTHCSGASPLRDPTPRVHARYCANQSPPASPSQNQPQGQREPRAQHPAPAAANTRARRTAPQSPTTANSHEANDATGAESPALKTQRPSSTPSHAAACGIPNANIRRAVTCNSLAPHARLSPVVGVPPTASTTPATRAFVNRFSAALVLGSLISNSASRSNQGR